MKTRFLSTLALAALPLALIPDAVQAQAARTIYLYNASVGGNANVAVDAQTAAWGNGTFRRARRADYEGAPTLQLTTRNFAEGIRFDLTRPLDITPYQNNGFVRLRLKFNALSTATTDGGNPGGGFPGGGAPGGGFPGGGFPGGGGAPGGGFPGGAPGGGGATDGTLFQMRPPATSPTWEGAAQFAPGGPLPGFGGAPGGFPGGGFPGGGMDGMGAGVPVGPPPQSTFIKELKITFLRETGVTTGRFKVDLTSNTPDDNGWHLFTLALKDMKSTPGTTGAVRRVVLTSDAQDTFFLAQMALVVETGEMTVSVRTPDRPVATQMAEVNFKPSQPLTLVADVEAGSSDPQVEWNFDADNVGLPRLDGGVTAGVPGMGMPGAMPGAPMPGAMRPGMGNTGIRPRPGAMQANPEGAGIGTGVAPLGPRIDARGLTASFTYPNEEQDYRVEVTVRDRSGKKQPVKSSILVHIRG